MGDLREGLRQPGEPGRVTLETTTRGTHTLQYTGEKGGTMTGTFTVRTEPANGEPRVESKPTDALQTLANLMSKWGEQQHDAPTTNLLGRVELSGFGDPLTPFKLIYRSEGGADRRIIALFEFETVTSSTRTYERNAATAVGRILDLAARYNAQQSEAARPPAVAEAPVQSQRRRRRWGWKKPR